MKISVLLSTYNNETSIKESILSIINQTYQDFEFLIINDDSTDNTEKIILDIAKHNNKIKYFRNKKRLGLTKNLNTLINYSSGTYIARIDADDIALSNRFQKQIEIFNQYGSVDVVFTDANIIDEKSNYLCSSWRPDNVKKILNILPIHNYIIHPSIMIKREVLINNHCYDEGFFIGQDKDLWLRLKKNGVIFYYLKEKLLNYRINSKSVRNSITDYNYLYTLAKVCINNNEKKKAFTFFKILKFKYKLLLFPRIFIPFALYKFAIYSYLFIKGINNSYLHKTK